MSGIVYRDLLLPSSVSCNFQNPQPINSFVKEVWLGKLQLRNFKFASSIIPTELGHCHQLQSRLSSRYKRSRCVQYHHPQVLPCGHGLDIIFQPSRPHPLVSPSQLPFQIKNDYNLVKQVQKMDQASQVLSVEILKNLITIQPKSQASKPTDPKAAKQQIEFSNTLWQDQWEC